MAASAAAVPASEPAVDQVGIAPGLAAAAPALMGVLAGAPERVLALQRAAGNAAVTRWLARAAQPAPPPPALKPFEELPVQGMVRLVSPLTAPQLAQELYGNSTRWQALVLAPNRELLATKADDRLAPGTQIRVLPELLLEPMRGIFLAVAGLITAGREGSREPQIGPNTEAPAAVGNRVRYGFSWGSLYDDIFLDWSLEHDPVAVRTQKAPARVQGPRGWISEKGNGWWFVTYDFPGTHVVRCRASLAGGKTFQLSYSQMVMTLAERTDVAAAGSADARIPPQELLVQLKKQADEMKVTDANVDQYGALRDRIRDLEGAVGAAGAGAMKPLRAIYISAEDRPVTLPLTVYFGLDPDRAGRPDLYYYLKLWDFTVGGKERTYTADDKSIDAAMRKLTRTFADDAPYPTGNIRFFVEATELSFAKVVAYSGSLSAQELTYPTDGGWLLDDVLRLLSGVALGVGATAAALGQPEVAIPALWVSGALAGAGAAVSLTDRIAHGNAKWDLETTIDLLDIAGALLSFGALRAAAEAVEGVGRMTVTEALNLDVGKAQLAIMAGVHVGAINAAIESKDEQRVVAALSAALRDGAILLIIHRAATPPRESGPKTGPGPGGAANDNVETGPPRPPNANVIPFPVSEETQTARPEFAATGTGDASPTTPRASRGKGARGGGGGGQRRQVPPKETATEPKPSGQAARPADLPTPTEDATIRQYTEGLAKLREAREFRERAAREQPRDPKRMQRAGNMYESAEKALQAIEEAALGERSEMLTHLQPLMDERARINAAPLLVDPKGRPVVAGTETGKRVPCQAVDALSDLQVRDSDFADVERALGRPPDYVDRPGGLGKPSSTASSHGRLAWRFADGSLVVVDKPRASGDRPTSADLPHVEFHGPKGERLDPNGIVVPERSIAAHMTISDRDNGMTTRHFVPSMTP